MSRCIDVNILLYSSDQASPYAARAKELLVELASGREVVCVAWTTLISYLRMSTHPSIFENPLTPQEAMENVESLLRLPQIRLLAEMEGFWAVYREVASTLPVRGNLVPDAHLAALLRQHGVTILYTNETDFLKFTFLRVRNPFHNP